VLSYIQITFISELREIVNHIQALPALVRMWGLSSSSAAAGQVAQQEFVDLRVVLASAGILLNKITYASILEIIWLDLPSMQKQASSLHLVSSYRREYCRRNNFLSSRGWKQSCSVRRSEAHPTTHDASFTRGDRITIRLCKSCRTYTWRKSDNLLP
jgi:hypothetical protein